MSLITVEKTTDLFWQTAGEGGLEANLQSPGNRPTRACSQFMLSIITSMFGTANSFVKLDKYGNGLSVLSCEHAHQVCWRILWLAPRLLGLPIFAYLTRPHHVGLHENKQVVVFAYAALEFLFIWQIVIRRSSVPHVLGVQQFFAALTMMAVPPVMLPSIRRMLPVYTTQRLISFFVMTLLGTSMSPVNSAHTELLLQPPAVIILAVFILTFLSWLTWAINCFVQQCCHPDTNGREDDYGLLGIEPHANFRERKAREAAGSGFVRGCCFRGRNSYNIPSARRSLCGPWCWRVGVGLVAWAEVCRSHDRSGGAHAQQKCRSADHEHSCSRARWGVVL